MLLQAYVMSVRKVGGSGEADVILEDLEKECSENYEKASQISETLIGRREAFEKKKEKKVKSEYVLELVNGILINKLVSESRSLHSFAALLSLG